MENMTTKEIFNNEYCWCVRHDNRGIWSVDNMTDEVLISSILEDILTAQYHKIPFNWYDLFRNLPASSISDSRYRTANRFRINRVLNLLVSDEVMNLVQFDGDLITIKPERVFMQAAMDLAGWWWEGYDIPPGVDVIRLSDEGRDLLEQLGPDVVAESLAMNLIATGIGSSAIQ